MGYYTNGYDKEGVPVRRWHTGVFNQAGIELIRKGKPLDPNIGSGGYRLGTSPEIAARALVKGGFSRTEVWRELCEDHPERKRESWSVTVNVVIKELLEKGFTLRGSFAAVPPPDTTQAHRR